MVISCPASGRCAGGSNKKLLHTKGLVLFYDWEELGMHLLFCVERRHFTFYVVLVHSEESQKEQESYSKVV